MRIDRRATTFSAWLVVCIAMLCAPTAPARGQAAAPSDSLLIEAASAATWTQGSTNIIQLSGPVSITIDTATMHADADAVVWLTPIPGAMLDQQRAQIALLGGARLEQEDGVTRSGDRLFVTVTVRGSIRITAEDRVAHDLSDTDVYQQAVQLRPDAGISPTTTTPAGPPDLTIPATNAPSTKPVESPRAPVLFHSRNAETTQSPEDKVALVLSGGVTLFQTRDNGDFIELQADRAVLFTTLNSLRDVGKTAGVSRVEDAVEAAYLEGDVRITFTPAPIAGKPPKLGEQRLTANRAYYEFATDRAVLTDAVLHTIEPQKQMPVVMRANVVRQLSQGEYQSQQVQLTTSAFATPTYAVAADRMYIRQVDTGDPRLGNRTTFVAHDVTFNTFGLPVLWLPVAAGSITDRGFPLRNLEFVQNSRFGTGVRSEWGLFESIGRMPPRDLDISFRADYLSDRGPATGLDASYGGGFITETTKDPWNFRGDFTSYIIEDSGKDEFGGDRVDIEPPGETRGRVLWEHQHFFPEDWQVQLRGGYVSDATFLEEYFPSTFRNDLPQDLSMYVKRQRQTEALTLLVNYQPQDFVTSSEFAQEQFEVEHLPEIGYRRIGDSLFNDNFTFFSENTVAGMRMHPSDTSLAEQGYPPGVSPGIPAVGHSGIEDNVVVRGDFRQELDYPINAGRLKIVPYILGRATSYSDSPEGDAKHRLLAGAGLRATTAFWKIDDAAQSDLFDIHRLRHIIEPEVHLFTSAQGVDQDDVFQYEQQIDRINDISAAQIALHQRWQTKRGGPGRWRNVDFLTLNVAGNMFLNQPRDGDLVPTNFRGMFFSSLPEASIPRNGINADAVWRVSDNTAVLSDVQWNADEGQLATASIGLAVSRDRLTYFLGTRYIEELDSNIGTVAVNYQLTSKYNIAVSESFNFAQTQDVSSAFTVERHFDRFFATFTIYYDSDTDESGFSIGLLPEGLSNGIASNSLSRIFAPSAPGSP